MIRSVDNIGSSPIFELFVVQHDYLSVPLSLSISVEGYMLYWAAPPRKAI